MKLWTLTTFYTVSILILSGCIGNPTPNKEPTIDSTLPVVELTEHGIALDSNAIAFEWKAIKDQRVKGIFVYKTLLKESQIGKEYYDTIKSRFITHYVDSNVLPDTKYSYYFKTFSDDAESIKSDIKVINSLPVLESVSWIHSIQNMPRTAKIIWRPHTNEKVKTYLIERKTLENDKWEVIKKVTKRLSAEYIDTDLKDKHVYKYRIRVLTYDGITSTPSQIVKVVTKALPKEINTITATRDLPKKIKLTWDKTQAKDFSHYNLYRSSSVDSSYEVIAKLKNNSFVDKCNEDAKQYFYRVSVVDKDGLESLYKKKSIQGLTLSKPNAPALVEVKYVDDKVSILWSKVDSRTKSYVLSKRTKKGWFDEIIEEFDGIKAQKFIDDKVKPNGIYYYKVYAVDKNGIKSEPSIEIEFKSKIVDLKDAVKSSSKKVSKIPKEKLVKESNTIIPVTDFN